MLWPKPVAWMQALAGAATRRSLVHNVVVMVDLGDLREGVWPDDLLPFVREILALPGRGTGAGALEHRA
jgi:predicted amino acid racemase